MKLPKLTNKVGIVGEDKTATFQFSRAWNMVETELEARQPLDGDLTALAALPATAGMLARTGPDAFEVRTLAATSPLSMANGNGASAPPTVSFSNQSANKVLAGPATGAAAAPAFRALVSDDMPSSGAGSGTVTSVALTGDGTVFNAAVPGSPVTASGTLAPSLHTQVQKTFFAGPTSGADAAPTFRTIAAADLPITQYTDEMAQDAVGAMVDGTMVYVDATPRLNRPALTGDV
jgi:hypothetical protein